MTHTIVLLENDKVVTYLRKLGPLRLASLRAQAAWHVKKGKKIPVWGSAR